MVELEVTADITNSPNARNLSRAQIDGLDLGFDNLDVMKNAPALRLLRLCARAFCRSTSRHKGLRSLRPR
jgi:hypothetical protein